MIIISSLTIGGISGEIGESLLFSAFLNLYLQCKLFIKDIFEMYQDIFQNRISTGIAHEAYETRGVQSYPPGF